MVREVRAVQSETAVRYYTCRNCNAKGEVAFHAIGDSGWQADTLLVDDVETDAATAAEEDLRNDAERVLGLIKCPTCKQRDPAYVRWAVLRPGVWFTLVGATFLFAGPYLSAVYGSIYLWIIAGGFGLGGIWQALRERNRFLRADAAQILRLKPGTPPNRDEPKQLPKPKPQLPPPQLPTARAITAPPITPLAPRGPDEEPAFLKKS